MRSHRLRLRPIGVSAALSIMVVAHADAAAKWAATLVFVCGRCNLRDERRWLRLTRLTDNPGNDTLPDWS